MRFDSIVFYGDPGLESTLFQTYMGRLGYQVRVVASAQEAVALLKLNPAMIAVIAAQNPKKAVPDFARALEAQSLPRKNKIFVLNDFDLNQSALPNMTVIHQPNRLSRVIHAIQSLNRGYLQA
jgi:CheY-like chemotaxis protein